MKKILNGILQSFGLLAIALCLLFFVCLTVLAFKPLRDVALSFFWGSVYRKAGETVMATAGGKPENLAIYKAEHKPFLIVGPCAFHRYDEKYGTKDDRADFFFVRPDSVIRSNVDQGGDLWFRIPGLLIIDDDLTSSDRVRTPSWDDLEHKDASVRYDEATASYVYSLRINEPEQSVSFAIPARLFTRDLLSAPNDTWKD